MPIKNNADAVRYIESIQTALEMVTVAGRQNCGIISAVCNDLDRVLKYLKEGGESSNGNTDNVLQPN